jgi:hypothetical protein
VKSESEIKRVFLLDGFLKIPRPFTGEGKRRGGCSFFCNRRDARARVLLAVRFPSPQPFSLHG